MRNKNFFETILPPRPAGYQQYDTFLVIMDNLLIEQSKGDYYMYIIRGENGEFIGRINLQMVNSENLKNAEIGYRIDFRKQGNGYAGHAIKLVLQEAFQKYGVSEVTAGTSIDNIGSQKVLEKNGFIKMGEEKNVLEINNEWVDGILYKKVHSEVTRGIIIFGSPGSGTTTLGKEVAKHLDFPSYDLDDYLWRWDTEIPFTVTIPRGERSQRLMEDISKSPYFVISGSMDSYNAPFVPLFDLAVLISAPADIRVNRINAREFARYGERIRQGGDMFESHNKFLESVRNYDFDGMMISRNVHEQWASTLPCPVLYKDGTKAISENAERIVEKYKASKN